MSQDLEMRFTDGMYATKNDVKSILKISSIDLMWEKIKEYRRHYQLELSVRNVERSPYTISTIQSVSSRIISLEKKLSKLLFSYNSLRHDSDSFQKFRERQYLECLKDFSSYYGFDIADETLKAIFDESLANIPSEYLMISHYCTALKKNENCFSSPFNLKVLVDIYSSLVGTEYELDKPETYLRVTDLNERINYTFGKRHYEGAPLDKILPMLNELFDFVMNTETFSLVKASVAFYYIMYVKPFEYFNEFVALLSFKYVLAHEDSDQIGTILNLEKLIDIMKDENGKTMMEETEMGLDMTYILNYILTHVEEAVKVLTDDFVMIEREQLKEEHYQLEKPVVAINNTKETTNNVVSNLVNEEEKVSTIQLERKVAIPHMRTGLDEKDAQIIAEHLMETYPSLKKGQASFYSRHCTVGNYYTIGQYKKELDVAYETARTSMENLALLGFYKKEKVRNKFVYTPVVQEKERI